MDVASELMTDRLRLREFRDDDLDVLAAMVGDDEQAAFYPRPKTRAEAAAWIRRNLGLYATHGFGSWLIEALRGLPPTPRRKTRTGQRGERTAWQVYRDRNGADFVALTTRPP